MMTLDETISDIEKGLFVQESALHYLKLFQAHEQRVRGQLDDLKEEYRPNDPLTWDELKTMEGKPVWVVVDGKERWRIIREVSSEHLILESGLPLHRSWMNHPDGWKVYRKERNEDLR